MLKQTYTSKKEELINFVLKPHNYECPKCQEVRYCDPDDYRSENGEFCSSEDCPSLKMMGEARALVDEMEYSDTYDGQELLGHWRMCNLLNRPVH
jgi:hypothetical protein